MTEPTRESGAPPAPLSLLSPEVEHVLKLSGFTSECVTLGKALAEIGGRMQAYGDSEALASTLVSALRNVGGGASDLAARLALYVVERREADADATGHKERAA